MANNSSSNKSFLVIGGGGFLGRYITEQLLARGEKNVRVFDKFKTWDDSRIEYVVGDLTEPEQVVNATKGIDCIIHTATASPGAPRNILEKVNLQGTKHIIEACTRNGVKQLIYTSTSSVVFDGNELNNVTEDAPYCTKIDAYNETKAAAEQLVLQANGTKGLMTCALRPSGLFGPRDNLLCPTLVKVGLSKKSRFAQIGDGKNLFDYTYIENVAHAHLLAADKLTPGSPVGGQAYFITNDEPIPFWNLPKRIWRDLDAPLPLFPLPKFLMFWIFFFLDFMLKLLYPLLKKNPLFLQMVINTTTTKTFSIAKAKRDLGYKPIVNMDEAMRRTTEYYKKEIKDGKFK